MRRHLFLIGSLVIGLAVLIALPQAGLIRFGPSRTTTALGKRPARSFAPTATWLRSSPKEVPQSVMPDSVFKASVKVPYQSDLQELGADGSQVPLQVGAVVMLPDGFTLAPQDRWTDEIKEETEGVFFSQYSDDQPNILLVGPIPGDQHQEIVFPVLSPDPNTDSNIHFGKYQIHVVATVGADRCIPPRKSNNTVFTAPASGTISSISDGENGASVITIDTADGATATETVPVGPALVVKTGDSVEAGAPLTDDPNVGGFGQVDAEVVLQNPVRIYGLLAFFAAVAIAQIMLVLKKKQIEKVQAAEGF